MSDHNFSDKAGEEFAELIRVIEKLRGPDGCPWDRRQTHETLRKYLIEESYEVVEAIEHGSPAKLREELGDVMLQVLLHAEISRQEGGFDIGDVCRILREKLVRRHPHVFGEVEVAGVDEVLHNWEEIKAGEPGYEDRRSILDGVPKSLPALMRAMEISKRAVRVGFEWPEVGGVLDKLQEEMDELKREIQAGDSERAAQEIGDLLFTVVNLARFLDADPEEALRETITRFSERFRKIESHAKERGRSLKDMSLEEMDAVWNEAKRVSNRKERKGG